MGEGFQGSSSRAAAQDARVLPSSLAEATLSILMIQKGSLRQQGTHPHSSIHQLSWILKPLLFLPPSERSHCSWSPSSHSLFTDLHLPSKDVENGPGVEVDC